VDSGDAGSVDAGAADSGEGGVDAGQPDAGSADASGDANDAGPDAADAGPSCPVGKHLCVCATGYYCANAGVPCVAPTSVCPP
jgi:hypothetical protein